MSPPVSICIPVYNGAKFIATALASVVSQTFTDFELIIVDNASTDGTVDVVRRFDDPRVRLVRANEHLSAAANWNRATAMCEGRYVKLLCADDALLPTCLERQVDALEDYPEASLTACLRDIVDETGRPLLRARGLAGMTGFVTGGEAIIRSVRRGTNVFGEPASVLMRGEALRATGQWSGDLPYMIDLELYFRLLTHGGLVAIPESLALFRVQTSSWSTAVASSQARQSIELFRRWRHAPASGIGLEDLLLGAWRAQCLRIARRLVYTRAFRFMHARRPVVKTAGMSTV